MVPLGITRTNVPDYLVRGGATYRIIPDHLGGPRFVVDVTTGVVAQEMRYDEFGRITLDTSPGFQPFGFAGGLYDHQTGLIRYGARDYDPEIGRWTTPDPSGFAGGLNLYVYADQNPQSFVDRTGEVPVAAGIAIAWGLIEAGLTIWDIYETGTTLMDPCASLGDKILSGGSMTMSAAGPGPASLYKGLGKGVKKALGAGDVPKGMANPLSGTRYTGKVRQQMRPHQRTGRPDNHGFPLEVDNFPGQGTTRQIVGRDGVSRTKVELPGSYQGREGTFEWIVEPDGTINHRLFVPDPRG